jgi:hypothetical protein
MRTRSASSAAELLYRIDDAARLARVRISGDTDFDAFVVAFGALLDDPAFRPGYGLIVYRRAPESRPDVGTVYRIIQWIRSHAAELRERRSAVVAEGPLAYGVSRLTSALVGAGGIALRVFGDAERAERWVRGEAA